LSTKITSLIVQTLKIDFTFGASAPAGTEKNGVITLDPAIDAVTVLLTPPDEDWAIGRIYGRSDAEVAVGDGYVDLVINRVRQNLQFGPIRSTYPAIQNPIRLPFTIPLPKNSQVNFLYKLLATGHATTLTATLYVDLLRAPAK